VKAHRLLLAALVLVAPLAIAPLVPADGTSNGAPGLAWHSCAGSFLCADLTVPISYAHPSLGSIKIAVAELPSTSAHPEGDVVMNPGGPGASGVDFLEQSGSSFPSSLLSHFNLVSFDPRGVERSAPVNCLSTAGIVQWSALDPDPTTPAQIDQVIAASKAFVAGCEAHTSKLLLANLGTINSARDMDRLRAALGQPKLTYIGFSYGTYLGALYANLFPSHVRAMVLDGAVDPDLSTVTTDIQQAQGFEVDLHDFYAWCSKDQGCRQGLPQGAATGYQQLINRLNSGAKIAALFPGQADLSQNLTVGLAELGVLSALYDSSDWSDLGQALDQALHGDGSLLASFAYYYSGLEPNGSFENIISAYTAISCIDFPNPSSVAQIESLAKTAARVAPDFGASEAWGGLPCAYWPIPPVGRSMDIHALGSPPIVVVGSSHDPATPYSWAQALASQLAHGVLLTRLGDGHTGYLNSACIQNWADRYLETLAVPPKGTVCASDA
jgi:pimeloyl-ACP methyl ester carboxylesterase